MNLRTYLMIKQAAEEAAAAADAAADAAAAEPAATAEKKTPEKPGFLYRMGRKGKVFGAHVGRGAKSHPYLTALGATAGAGVGGLGGLGVANLAGLSGDDLSTAGRVGRYALIGGGALGGGLLGGTLTPYFLDKRDRANQRVGTLQGPAVDAQL